MSDHGIYVFPDSDASSWGHPIKNLLPAAAECGHVLTIMFFEGAHPVCELEDAHDGDHVNFDNDLAWGVDGYGTWHINPPRYEGTFTLRGSKV